MANEIQRIIPKLHNNNVTQFTVKYSSYTNATTSYLIDDLLAYYYVSTFANTKTDCTHPMISLGADVVLCHAEDACKTVHTSAPSKMPQHNIVNNI